MRHPHLSHSLFFICAICSVLLILLAIFLWPMQGIHYAPKDEEARPDTSQYTTVSLAEADTLAQEFRTSVRYSDGSSASGTIAIPNMESGFALTFYPQTLEDTAAYLSEGGKENAPVITSFSFSGIGTECLEKTITVEWYQN